MRPIVQQIGEHTPEPVGAFGNCFSIDVLIDGVKTCCLLYAGSEVTTLTKSYFRELFEGRGCLLSPVCQMGKVDRP